MRILSNIFLLFIFMVSVANASRQQTYHFSITNMTGSTLKLIKVDGTQYCNKQHRCKIIQIPKIIQSNTVGKMIVASPPSGQQINLFYKNSNNDYWIQVMLADRAMSQMANAAAVQFNPLNKKWCDYVMNASRISTFGADLTVKTQCVQSY